MSLNSDASVIPSCGGSFWEVDGHQRVVKRAENGSQMCHELSKLVLERAEIERDYAKRLKSWSSKWTESVETGPEYGSNKAAVCVMLNEADLMAEVHLSVRDKLVNEIIPQIKDWKSENYKKQLIGGCKEAKTFEDDFHRVQKPWAKKLAKVMKAKKDYYTACKLERTAANQENNAKNSSDLSTDQIKRFQEKVEKCRKEVDLTRDIYKASLAELNSSNSKYIEEMTEVFSKAQDFESKRLLFNKKLFYNIHSCLDLSYNKQIADIYAEFHKAIDRCDASGDLKWWADAYGTGMPMNWPAYEEYIGEFHAISRKERGMQFAHVGGAADGIKLTSIQHSENSVDGISTIASKPTGVLSSRNHSDDEWDDVESVVNGAVGKKNQSSDVTNRTLVRALYDYTGTEDDELSFKAGDTLVKLRDRDELGWCSGQINGRTGLFPDNYVEQLSQ